MNPLATDSVLTLRAMKAALAASLLAVVALLWLLSRLATPAEARRALLAAGGNAEAQYFCGLRWEALRRGDKAADYYRKAARSGFVPAKYRLGRALSAGAWLQANPAEGFRLEQEAAQQGYGPAQYAVGTAFTAGSGVAADESQALLWYEKAARQGFAPAMHAVGLAYQVGRAAPHDLALAYQWHFAEQTLSHRECPQAGFLLRLVRKEKLQAAQAQALAFLKGVKRPESVE